MQELEMGIVRVAEAAAIAAAEWRGHGDKRSADRAATGAMRNALASLSCRGIVRISEGVMDDCTEEEMLIVGEKLGSWQRRNLKVSIAVDPLEGTKLCAHNQSGAISSIAMTDGPILAAPDMYMEKIAVGPHAKDAIDLTRDIAWNLGSVAEAKRVRVSELTAVVLDRERHHMLISEIRNAGARVHLITDGDLLAAISTAIEGSGVDILFGSGGAPEGVLAAAALRALGGDMVGKLNPQTDEEAVKAERVTKRPSNYIYSIEEMAGGDVLFAATGVTSGSVLRGVRFLQNGGMVTHSLLTSSRAGVLTFLERHVRA